MSYRLAPGDVQVTSPLFALSLTLILVVCWAWYKMLSHYTQSLITHMWPANRVTALKSDGSKKTETTLDCEIRDRGDIFRVPFWGWGVCPRHPSITAPAEQQLLHPCSFSESVQAKESAWQRQKVCNGTSDRASSQWKKDSSLYWPSKHAFTACQSLPNRLFP